MTDRALTPDDHDRQQELLRLARERFRDVQAAESMSRERERREQRFRAGRQWDERLQETRRLDQRPCLTMNRIPQFLNQIVNEQVLFPQAMHVQPVDDQADIETAKILLGIFRNIEVTSQADVAYRTAYKPAVGEGVGYFRVITEYESPTSFQQVIRIKRIRNRFCCYLDPHHQELDGSDANYGFVVERLGRTEYEQRYGQPAPGVKGPRGGVRMDTTSEIWVGTGDSWITPDEVQVAEYFERTWVREELVLLASGEVRLSRETGPQDIVVHRRPTEIPVVHWYKINGHEILQATRWLGTTIPIIPVYGNEEDLDGEIEHTGVVHGMMDPQMLVNYMASAEAEAIGLAPRAPFVMAAGQIEGFEEYWQTANSRNHAFLPYTPVAIGGTLAPPPQRLAVEPAVQAISQARLFAIEDMKATIGLYDASLGARSNETSGIAIRERQREGNLATAHYPANLRVAIRRCAMICLELIPKVYDQDQMTRIIGENEEPELVPINREFVDSAGKKKVYDLRKGRYDVVPSSAPSFQTQREEAANKINGLVSAYPPVMAVAGDYLVRNLDMPYAQEIAARLRTQIPPEALAATESGKAEEQVALLQNQVAVLSQQVQALNAYAQEGEAKVQEAQQRAAELALQQEAAQARLAAKADELRLKGRELDLKQRALDLEEEQMHLTHQIALAKVDIDEQKAGVVARNGQEKTYE